MKHGTGSLIFTLILPIISKLGHILLPLFLKYLSRTSLAKIYMYEHMLIHYKHKHVCIWLECVRCIERWDLWFARPKWPCELFLREDKNCGNDVTDADSCIFYAKVVLSRAGQQKYSQVCLLQALCCSRNRRFRSVPYFYLKTEIS